MHAQVLEAIVELCVRHLDRQLLENVGVLRVEVEAHLHEPIERLDGGDAVRDELARHVALVHQLADLSTNGQPQVQGQYTGQVMQFKDCSRLFSNTIPLLWIKLANYNDFSCTFYSKVVFQCCHIVFHFYSIL